MYERFFQIARPCAIAVRPASAGILFALLVVWSGTQLIFNGAKIIAAYSF